MSDNSIESILSMISKNPDLVNKISSAVQSGGDDLSKSLSSVISLISESQEKEGDAVSSFEETTETTDTPPKEFQMAGNFSSNSKTDSFLLSLSKSISKNSSLFLALKPYLSKSRCEMIDTVVKISQIANVMNLAK